MLGQLSNDVQILVKVNTEGTASLKAMQTDLANLSNSVSQLASKATAMQSALAKAGGGAASSNISNLTGNINQLTPAVSNATTALNNKATALNNVNNATSFTLLRVAKLIIAYQAIYAVVNLVKGAFDLWYNTLSTGIEKVGEYQMEIYSFAASMTSLTAPGINKEKAAGEWEEYARWLRAKSLEMDRFVAASGTEIFTIAMELAKRGVVANTKEMVLQIGHITDTLKNATRGMNFGQQAFSEIRNLFVGGRELNAQLLQEFTKISPKFKEEFAKIRNEMFMTGDSGPMLAYMSKLLEGWSIMSKKMKDTFPAVLSSGKAAFEQLMITAFEPAEKQVSNLVGRMIDLIYQNGQLTVVGERVATILRSTWDSVNEKLTEYVEKLEKDPDLLIEALETVYKVANKVADVFLDIVLALPDIVVGIKDFYTWLGKAYEEITKIYDKITSDDFKLAVATLAGITVGAGVGGATGGLGGAILGGGIGGTVAFTAENFKLMYDRLYGVNKELNTTVDTSMDWLDTTGKLVTRLSIMDKYIKGIKQDSTTMFGQGTKKGFGDNAPPTPPLTKKFTEMSEAEKKLMFSVEKMIDDFNKTWAKATGNVYAQLEEYAIGSLDKIEEKRRELMAHPGTSAFAESSAYRLRDALKEALEAKREMAALDLEKSVLSGDSSYGASLRKIGMQYDELMNKIKGFDQAKNILGENLYNAPTSGGVPLTDTILPKIGSQLGTIKESATMARSEIEKVLWQASQTSGVPFLLGKAVMGQESGGNKRALSPKGAMGLMQLMPDTAAGLGVTDPYDVVQNINAGMKYLSQQYAKFKDWGLALAAYNAGPRNVERYNGIPPFKETQNYVPSILNKWAKLQRTESSNPDFSDSPSKLSVIKDVTNADDPNRLVVIRNITKELDKQIEATTLLQQGSQQIVQEKVAEIAVAGRRSNITEKQLTDMATMNKIVAESVLALNEEANAIGRQKTYLEEIASGTTSPVEQLAKRRELLAVDRQITDLKLDADIISRRASLEEANLLKTYKAQADVLKEQAQTRKEWMTQGTSGGSKEWATRQLESSQTRDAEATISAFDNAKSFIGDSLASAFVSGLKGEKIKLEDIGYTIAGGFVKTLTDKLMNTLFDGIANMILGGDKKEGGLGKMGQAAGAVGEGIGGLRSTDLKKFTKGLSDYTKFEAKDMKLEVKQNKLFDKSVDKMDDAITREFYPASTDLVDAAGYTYDASGNLVKAGGMGLNAAGLNTTSATMGTANTVAMGVSALGMGLAAIGMMTGSKEMSTAGMVISMAAQLFMVAVMVGKAFGFLHMGGVVAHTGGVLTAHSGMLLPDERIIKAQTGEGVLQRSAMAKLGRDNFLSLNSGDFSFMNNSNGGGRGGDNYNVSVNVPILANHKMTQSEWNKEAKKVGVAMDRQLRRSGEKVGSRRG